MPASSLVPRPNVCLLLASYPDLTCHFSRNIHCCVCWSGTRLTAHIYRTISYGKLMSDKPHPSTTSVHPYLDLTNNSLYWSQREYMPRPQLYHLIVVCTHTPHSGPPTPPVAPHTPTPYLLHLLLPFFPNASSPPPPPTHWLLVLPRTHSRIQ